MPLKPRVASIGGVGMPTYVTHAEEFAANIFVFGGGAQGVRQVRAS